jgi:hypothetical protein
MLQLAAQPRLVEEAADGRLVGTFVSPQAYTMVSGGWGVM